MSSQSLLPPVGSLWITVMDTACNKGTDKDSAGFTIIRPGNTFIVLRHKPPYTEILFGGGVGLVFHTHISARCQRLE